MTEKCFSVVAELADGTSKVLPVRAGSSGEAFRQVRETPRVRRVGRVAEISEPAFAALGEGKPVAARQQTPPTSVSQIKPTDVSESPRPLVQHVISGPRTVVYAPPTGGEMPFKHLQAPPERPKPPQTAKPPAAKKAPELNATPAESMRMPQAPSATQYRVVKSRRRDGLPYLVQRGQWQQLHDKRTFDVQWEKGFPDREQAVKHLDWVEHNEQELVALQSA
jgi:hypothetical protein